MRLVSVHIPRTGGISLWAQLCSAFAGSFAQDYQHDPMGGNYAGQPWPEGKRIIHGHFRPDLYKGDFYMTWLRHPVEQVISLYGCWCVIGPEHRLIKRFQTEKPTLLEFADWEPVRHLLSVTWFGGFPMDRFGFIGCFERRESDLVRLGAMLGISLDPGFKQIIERPKFDVQPEERQILQNLLTDDIAFYREVSDLA